MASTPKLSPDQITQVAELVAGYISAQRELYVRGFSNGGSYEAIPLEVNAYSLEDRFRREPRRVFSVQAEVTQWLVEGKL